MSDFTENVKHLDIIPITEAPDGLSDRRVNHRPPQIDSNVRDIKKLRYRIKVPAYTKANPLNNAPSTIGWQYNYTAAHPFRLYFNPADIQNQLAFGSISVRYRVGTTVYRYFITGHTVNGLTLHQHTLDPIPGWKMYDAEVYANQLIQPNFVIEAWYSPRLAPFTGVFLEIFEDLYIETSILVNPVDVNQTGILFPEGTLIDATLAHTFPEPIPTDYTDGAWLSN